MTSRDAECQCFTAGNFIFLVSFTNTVLYTTSRHKDCQSHTAGHLIYLVSFTNRELYTK
jgi:hypothetical protein